MFLGILGVFANTKRNQMRKQNLMKRLTQLHLRVKRSEEKKTDNSETISTNTRLLLIFDFKKSFYL